MILECKVLYPAAFTDAFVDLLRNLLVTDPAKRFSSSEVLSHAWFQPIVWSDLMARAIKPPYIPAFVHEGDAAHFDKFAEEEIRNSPVEEFPDVFAGF